MPGQGVAQLGSFAQGEQRLMAPGFLAGAGSWIISGGPAPRGLFRIGLIDSVGVAVMAAAMILAFRAAQRALTASVIRSSTR